MDSTQLLLSALGICVTIIGFGIRALFKMQTQMERLATNQENAIRDHLEIKELMQKLSTQQNEHDSRIAVLESTRRGGYNSSGGLSFQGGH